MSHTPSSSPGVPGSRGTPLGEPTSGIVDQAQGSLGQVADQAQTTAGQVTQQAKQQATSQLESQKARAVDSLVTVAQALRQTGQHLHQQDQATVGGYVEQAAERIESLTNYLRAREVPELVAETQDFARRQPGLFLTGAVALGFIGARFLMSSGQRAARRSSYAAGGPTYPSSYGQAAAYPSATGAAYAGDMPGYTGGSGASTGGTPGYTGGGAAMPSATGSTYGGNTVPPSSGSASAIDAPDVSSPDRPDSGGLTGSPEA